jgi:hypothetical protein
MFARSVCLPGSQAVRGNTHTEELQRTLVAELEGARAASERASAVSNLLYLERERTAGAAAPDSNTVALLRYRPIMGCWFGFQGGVFESERLLCS